MGSGKAKGETTVKTAKPRRTVLDHLLVLCLASSWDGTFIAQS